MLLLLQRRGRRNQRRQLQWLPHANLFAFSCTSDYAEIAQGLNLPDTKLGGGIIDTGASSHFCPDRTKFRNYRPSCRHAIRTADGRHMLPRSWRCYHPIT